MLTDRSLQNANRKKAISLSRVLSIIFIIFIALIVVSPFYVSIMYSIRYDSEVTVSRLAWPKQPTLDNYIRVFSENPYVSIGFKNSVLTTIPTVLILLVTTSMSSYVLARNNELFYKIAYAIIISGILIPFQCIMLPLYVNMYNANLTSSNVGFVIARVGFQVSISILTVTGFVKGIPRELEESAQIDGCNELRTFWQIVFPLMQPINVTQLVLNTLFVWNDYSIAVVLLREDTSRTLPLAQIIYFGEKSTELNLAFAFFLIAALPIIILYLFTQKYIIAGITSGAVKG